MSVSLVCERLRLNDCELTALDLDGNDIGAEGAEHLADALKNNTVLTALKLFGNGIGDEGAAPCRHVEDQHRPPGA